MEQAYPRPYSFPSSGRPDWLLYSVEQQASGIAGICDCGGVLDVGLRSKSMDAPLPAGRCSTRIGTHGLIPHHDSSSRWLAEKTGELVKMAQRTARAGRETAESRSKLHPEMASWEPTTNPGPQLFAALRSCRYVQAGGRDRDWSSARSVFLPWRILTPTGSSSTSPILKKLLTNSNVSLALLR